METKKVLMNWRGAPIGARTPDGYGGIANANTRSGRTASPTERLGRALRCYLTAVLILFAAQGAWAQPTHVSTSEGVFTDGRNGEKPCMYVINSTYDVEKNLNVYDVRINYAFANDYVAALREWAQGGVTYSGSDVSACANRLNSTGNETNEWDGDVWLKLDGKDICNLSTITDINDANCHFGKASTYLWYDANNTSSYKDWTWASDYPQVVNNNGCEVNSKSATGLGNQSSVYVALVDTKDFRVYHENVRYVVKTMVVRIGIERTWQHRNIGLEISGHWRIRKYGWLRFDNNVFSMSTTLTPPKAPFPSNGGSLKRTGNGKLTYTAPTGLYTKTGKQVKSNSNNVSELENCNFIHNIILMKTEGAQNEPYASINNSSNRYAYISNATSSQTQEITGVDNWKTITVYPCWELASESSYFSMPRLNTTYTQHHNKFMDPITIPGNPRPKNLVVSAYNNYTKQVDLTWERDAYDSSTYSDGKWYIYRKVTGQPETQVLLGYVSNGTYTYSDKTGELNYGSTYTYTVCYCPKGWDLNSEADATGLSSFVRHTQNRDFSFSNVKAQEDGDQIVFSWNHSGILDASNSKKYSLYVQRSDDGGTTWETKRTDEITSKETTSGSFSDDQVVAHKQYKYRLKINVQEKDFTSSEASATVSNGSKLTGFSASRGNYTQSVKLTWTVNQVGTAPTYFTLQRRPLGSNDESAWLDIYTTSGTATTYSYEDQTAQPGSFNEYRLKIFDIYEGTRFEGTPKTTDGFCIATGVVGGRITYGSGTAVEGAKVSLKAINADGNDMKNKRSIKLDGSSGQGFKATMSNEELKKIFGGDFTVQMWVNPDMLNNMSSGANKLLFDVRNTFSVYLRKVENVEQFLIKNYIDGGNREIEGDTIPGGQWSHLTFVYSNNQLKIRVRQNDQGWLRQFTLDNPVDTTKLSDGDGIVLGNSVRMNHGERFAGYVDEVRVFNRALSDDEIVKNYNHTLTGSEEGLVLYWPFDEGMDDQTIAYDFSKKNGISNGHHAVATVAAHSEATVVPNDEQLSLMAYTDQNGNYSVGGIHFSGEGTSYTITPSLGVHKFNPGNEQRFINLNALVHSGVNFEDVSSFKVSGTVYYEGTTVPVKEAYLYVDGVLASKDGNPIMTNSNGEFTVDVPIGDHFVSVKKSGHTFVNEGRYPADLNGTGERETFEDDMSGLTFYDNTKVMIAGRVAGGDVEFNKPLCVGSGLANLGKATITLTYDGVGNINPDSVDVEYEEYYGTAFATANADASANEIVIHTDEGSGEWAAQLLPLRYSVKSVKIDNDTENLYTQFSGMSDIDATNPDLVYTDSVQGGKDNWRKFSYNASSKIEYKAPSTFTVKENEDGSFGMKQYTVVDGNGTKQNVDLYYFDPEDGNKLKYTFGHPIYQELDTYQYEISGYEEYTNADNGDVDRVPLIGKSVVVSNQYAATTSVELDGKVHEVKDNTFQLDSLGCALYEFTVGFPNIQDEFTRSFTVGYGEGSDMVTAFQMEAVVLGGLPTGNNFVTTGPDEILMVLRDPPGTGSQTIWSKGSTVTSTKTFTAEPHSNTSLTSTLHAGFDQSIAEGLGVMVIQDFEVTADLSIGAELNVSVNTAKTKTTSITATKDITTKDGMDFDGANGDVFVGTAKNLIFGACRAVDVRWNTQTNRPELSMKEALSTGEQFTTSFAYEQNYVQNTLIPNFKRLRNAELLPKGSNPAQPAKGQMPVYVSKLDPDDPNYGSSNSDVKVWKTQAKAISTMENGVYDGPSYKMILPADYKVQCYQDTINFFNLQIAKWEKTLANNEKAKVTAIENRDEWLIENHSFSAGATVTVSTTRENTEALTVTSTEEVNVVLGSSIGATVSGIGATVELNETAGVTSTQEFGDETTHSLTTTYSLVEDGDDDYLSVDVFKAPDGFGPIFYTKAGATSCPFEDEVKTQYFEPGEHVIMEKTTQIEMPEIEVVDGVVTGVPSGQKATFQVRLRNNSETGEDGWYDIMVVPETNKKGLQVYMDGQNITEGHSLMVKAGETMTKTFSAQQADLSVLDYQGIKIRIASQCQRDNTSTYAEIADTSEVNIYFQPACSDIKLASTHTLVNSKTSDAVTLKISGYNHSLASLKGVRLQYKGEHDADFRTLQEYSKDTLRVNADPNLILLPALTGANTLNYTIDLRDDAFTDKTYVFRAITVCNISNDEVNNESNEIVIVRDMTRPQLMATPSPASGILSSGDDLLITFNEDIQGGALTKPDNFEVKGVLNESEILHDVALSLTGENAAKTDATMDLAGKSFSASMWLNYAEDGRLLMHGTKDDNFTVSIESGKLVVAVNDSKATSTATLPTGKWMYLNVSYDAQTNTVSAGYAQDASTVSLLANDVLPAYEGNGPVSVGGNNFVGKVQELAIWNDFRSMAQAQGDMYTTKSQFTNGLMGYWPLDEGHGDVATDKARSRNMTLPSVNAWWINGDNYAVTLDGTKAAAVNIGSLNTTANDDYLVEAWFKADESNDATASVLSTQVMDLRLNAEGKMELALPSANAEGTVTAVYNKDLRDGQWHHVAVNVLKSNNGSGIIYVDGQQRKQFASSAMPALYGEKLMLGGRAVCVDGMSLYNYDELLKGAIDEVRIWKGRRTADVIKNNMYQRVKADETGLVAYYPMESFSTDGYGQTVSAATLKETVNDQNEMVFYTAGAATVDGATTKANTAALKQAPKMENVEFSFVASERQIKVNLEELPSKMEGCNIYITAKNVRDMNGNVALPITWSVYVQQNNLKWQENDLAVTKTGAEEATFTATIENRGSQSENWSLNDLPTWLSAKTAAGTLMPLTSQKLTFTVAGSLPIGTYETTVYLTGSQNINAPLNITVTSEGDAPDWDAVPGESTMTIVGVLNIDNVQSSDPKDMVAAFRGTECVGVAHPKYFSRYDSYIVMMNIFGAGEDEAPLTYKAYDASTGTVYPSVSVNNESAYSFVADKSVGTFTQPVVFTPLNEIEQDLSMDRAAWKWFSLFAQTITNGTNSVVNWEGGLTAIESGKMYKLSAMKPYVETLVGEPIDPTSVSLTLNPEWTWLGYPCQAINSLDAAFTGADPQEGDMVKNQTSFSIYTGNKWEGTLTALQPGDGYMYNSTVGTAKTFNFPKPTVSGKMNAPRRILHSSLSTLNFKDNMTMIAVVMDGDELVENAQVSVYSGTELRAFSGEAIRVNLSV